MNGNKQEILNRLETLLNENTGVPANVESFSYARDFIEAHRIGQSFTPAMGEQGEAVFEFHGNGIYEFAEMTFLDTGSVSCYWRGRGEESRQFETHHTSNELTVFFQNLVG